MRNLTFEKPHKIRHYFDKFRQELNLWVNIVQVKLLAADNYNIVAVMDGDICIVEDFLVNGEATTLAARQGFTQILEYVAEHGLQKASSAWLHEVDKANGIYEFIKGSLRLFFFKGNGKDIAICTVGGRKKGSKVDKFAVNSSIVWQRKYVAALVNGTYKVIENED